MENILDTNLLNNESLVGGCAAFGQGGYGLMVETAIELGISPENCFAINTSKADLLKATFVPQENRLLIAPEGNGAGKDRDLVFSMIAQTNEDIINQINTKLNGKCNIFFVFYSADGGTGSGAGPAMTAMFTGSKFKKNSGTTPVIGVCALPDHFVGKDALKNTIENLNQTNILLNKGAVRMMFVNNDVYSDIKDKSVRWKTANKDAAELLKRYLIQNFLSDTQNLDFSDRMKCLDQVGQHALCKFKPNGEFTSPFILPEGVNVSKLAVEMPVGYPDAVDKLKSTIGCTVSEESFSGLYNEGIEGAYPIAHFSGFYNLEKLATTYDGWLKQIIQKEQAQKKIDVESGRGFKDIANTAQYIKEESSVKEIDSFNDIFSALAGN